MDHFIKISEFKKIVLVVRSIINTVIGSFVGDQDIVGVALEMPCRGNPDKACLFMHLPDIL